MSFEKLARLDLNLLVCLHVLLEHNSVSKASEHLNLSQSAISKSLARLRELFDDPLLERSGYGMEPTPKAKQLKPELVNLLFDIEKLTAPTTFDPEQSTRSFQMAVVESIYTLLFPNFIGEALSIAPKLTIDTCNWGSDTFEQLQKGELDFAITGKDLNPEDAERTLTPPKGIISAELYQDELCCIVNTEHPVLVQKWDLEAYISYRHIVTKYYKKERWLLDVKLAEKRLKRDVALYVPDFNSAAELCCHTELILTAPSLYANHVASLSNLKVIPLPFSLPPLSYTLFWHEKRESDLAHLWLKNLMISRCQKLAVTSK
ncbi:TPA: LysR family transcriptional regulator [Vibrio parahaemolyticus]|uniref:LysR family transcriptional regulator n=1 Tax=Vibrio parahaemolyticus TaxID=670 RepID=UPI0011248548|nr:LysR family transcriptional regulator [Vibrio parahaemolyticus]MDF4940781.1 LysR family transcriptional regulator [Vibrio parahaemolyticus]TOK38012.1 LysR family transcriptional regulator [Vibrio parahaemolyticus]HCE3704367.1 LysR family transcriptional regulator [Vibrio parahaemolyticus]HCE3706172.1 LysR family transcriptional regulator [Vibrio parahaemolyticus]